MILDVITALLILGNVAVGYKRGIIGMVLSIAIFFVAIFLARVLYEPVVAMVSATPLYTTVLNWVMSHINLGDAVGYATADIQAQVIDNLPIPPLIAGMLNLDELINVGSLVDVTSIELGIGYAITDIIISAISMVVLVLVIIFVLKIIAGSINLIAMLPGLRFFNKNLGAMAGGFQGVIIVWLLLIIYNFSVLTGNVIFYELLETSTVTQWLNDRNFIWGLL